MEPDKINLIYQILIAHAEAKAVIMRVEVLFGQNMEGSRFHDAIIDPLDRLVDAVSGVVGDHMNWIHWYIASGYGKKPIVAKGREIRTIDDLIWLIDECGKSQPE